MSDTSLTVVDSQTGLVTQEEVSIGTTQFLGLLEELNLGDRRLLLQDTTMSLYVPMEERADVMDAYSVEPIRFGDVVNQKLLVFGACLFEFEAGLNREGIWHERYFQARILVELEGKLVVVKSSGSLLLRHVAYMCNKHGWHLFREGPIEYKFVHKGSGFPHYMDRTDKQIKRIVPKSQR